MNNTLIKTLTDAGAVVILALSLLFIVMTIGRLVRAFIGVMDEYVGALKESNKQTSLFRKAITRMDERHAELLVGNNSIVHLTYERVGGLEGLIDKHATAVTKALTAHELAANLRNQQILSAMIQLSPSLAVNLIAKEEPKEIEEVKESPADVQHEP